MSSTNRGSERNKEDYYITPHQTIHGFLKAIEKAEPGINFIDGLILDPCAGGDEINGMSYPLVLGKLGATNVSTIDIRDDSRAAVKGNYLRMELATKYDLIITNPPYNLGMEFIVKGLEDVKDGGFVAMLMRLNYFGSIKRHSFWQTHLPKYTFVHSNRPSFMKGGTDSAEYAHLVWQKNHYPEWSKLRVI